MKSKRKKAELSPKIAIGVLVVVTILFLLANSVIKFPPLNYLKAALIQMMISPAAPVPTAIYPATIIKGSVVMVRLTGQNFISGYDPVEKVGITPIGGGITVYSRDIKVKDENTITAQVDTSLIPLGTATISVVNEFDGRDIPSSTTVNVSLVERSSIVVDSPGLDPLNSLDSALDQTIAETVTVDNSADVSLALGMPANFFSDSNETFNLHVDGYSKEEYAKDGGIAGANIPSDLGAIDTIYDLKFKNGADEAVTTTDRPVILTFRYNSASIIARGLSPSTLRVYHWNSVNSRWEVAPSSQVSLAESKVTAAVSTFSPYTVFGSFECNDGIDNDSNGKTDYPADTGCSSATDGTESGGVVASVSPSGGGPISYMTNLLYQPTTKTEASVKNKNVVAVVMPEKQSPQTAKKVATISPIKNVNIVKPATPLIKKDQTSLKTGDKEKSLTKNIFTKKEDTKSKEIKINRVEKIKLSINKLFNAVTTPFKSFIHRFFRITL